MKTLLSIFILLAGTTFSQTTLIAHKSHSGNASTFTFADPGNFGAIELFNQMPSMPLPVIVKVTKLSDSTVIMTSKQEEILKTDTIYRHPIFNDANMSVDTMRVIYPEVQFENFEKPETIKAEPAPEQKTPVKKKSTAPVKKGHLVWLWIIGGGTFTGILLTSRRRRKISVKYA